MNLHQIYTITFTCKIYTTTRQFHLAEVPALLALV